MLRVLYTPVQIDFCTGCHVKRKPIIYEAEVEVRFDDLDSYGHVNSSRYLDYVITSRWKFAQANLSYSVQSLHDRGAGVYLTRSPLRTKLLIEAYQLLHWVLPTTRANHL